jgi:hypothetical protein
MKSFLSRTFQSEAQWRRKGGLFLPLRVFSDRKCSYIQIVQSLFIVLHVSCSILLKSRLTEVDQTCPVTAIHTNHWPSTGMQGDRAWKPQLSSQDLYGHFGRIHTQFCRRQEVEKPPEWSSMSLVSLSFQSCLDAT